MGNIRLKIKVCIGLLALTLGFPDTGGAQQDAIYSQYMFNPMAINPAYAGSREAFSSVFLLRQQWSGIDGAPATGSFALHGPLKGKKVALGLNFVHDEIGPLSTTSLAFTYAYHLSLPKGKLSLGLRGGAYLGSFDYNKLNYDDPQDKFNMSGSQSAGTASFDFGAYYYTRKFFLGLSATHLEGSALDFGTSPDSSNVLALERHFMASSGVALEVNDNMVFKPSILVKYVANAPINVDINASMLFKKVFWFGVSYRHGSAIAMITEYNITDWMRLGYSYDVVLNRLKRFTGGSHEVFFGFDFLINNKHKALSPRYM